MPIVSLHSMIIEWEWKLKLLFIAIVNTSNERILS